jgi:Asp-tRNA(Asn)/Glu-tRNA(Gln) amidotransferase A subunit family amidase
MSALVVMAGTTRCRENSVVYFTGNVTGVPAITVPNGFGEDNLSTAMQFMGIVWSEKTMLDIAVQYQSRTDWHKRQPPVDQWMKSKG